MLQTMLDKELWSMKLTSGTTLALQQTALWDWWLSGG